MADQHGTQQPTTTGLTTERRKADCNKVISTTRLLVDRMESADGSCHSSNNGSNDCNNSNNNGNNNGNFDGDNNGNNNGNNEGNKAKEAEF